MMPHTLNMGTTLSILLDGFCFLLFCNIYSLTITQIQVQNFWIIKKKDLVLESSLGRSMNLQIGYSLTNLIHLLATQFCFLPQLMNEIIINQTNFQPSN